MTLATAILFVSVFSVTSSNPGLLAYSAPQSSAVESSGNTSPAQPQSPENELPPQEMKPTPAQQSEPSTVAPPKTRKGKKRHHNKKAATPSGCAPASASSTSAGSDTPLATPQTGGAGPAQAGSGTETPKPCTPQKIVVRKGGITEQSIQLAGGSGGDQATQKRNAATKMLAATEGNLKQITGRQLSTSQHDSISQIQQFVDQSKSALAAGDLERAQTLAWKAQLLSEDLINPEK
jgi:hypothetical protein